jgi:hypothetical protein
MISTLIQLHTEHVMEEVIKPKGSVTWFKCKDGLPPTTNKTELGHYSDHVLISDGINVDKKEFVRTVNETPVGWMGSNLIGFVPTHWAFINKPEPVQD